MGKTSWKQRVSYWLDNQLAKGPWVLIGWLGVFAFLIVLFSSVLALVFNFQPTDAGFKEVFWDFLFQALTPNPFDVTAPLPFLLVILVITVLSLLMVSVLIGLLTTSIEGRLEAMQRGRSRVLERDHTVILGWSHQVFTIVSELVIANENRKRGAVVVILANQDKVEMDHRIRERLPHLKNTRVICRSGSPMDLDDLEIASPHTARSIIVLPPEEDNPDAYVIKTILAITNNPKRRAEAYHIVTEIQSKHNMEVVEMIGARDDVHPLLVGDQIARIIAQTSRQSGLSVVFTELLNFSGDEIYFQNEPRLSGKAYGDALLSYEDSALIGLRLANGSLRINPPADTLIAAGDEIIAISKDDDTVKLALGGAGTVAKAAIQPLKSVPLPQPEKSLILGWNSKAPVIIEKLETYVAPGSELCVVTGAALTEEDQAAGKSCRNQKITFRSGDISEHAVLDRLDVPSFQHVIVLAEDATDEQSADAETMVALLHLRNIVEKSGKRPAIVSEMLDLRNRRLADVAKADDFIVSDHLISLMLAQVSENGELYEVFTELFDSAGVEIFFKPVTDYIDVSQPVSFYTLIEAGRQRGETAIGYRVMKEMNDAANAYGIVTNPKKSKEVQFSKEDKLIVLAEPIQYA